MSSMELKMSFEQRRLTSRELDVLIHDASDNEKRWIKLVCDSINMQPIELFGRYAIDWEGLVIDGVPAYVAGIFLNKNELEFWTIVNKDVKKQLTFFKCAKRGLSRWSNQFTEIYATMMKSWDKNREWTERLGFVPCRETEDTITYVLKQEK